MTLPVSGSRRQRGKEARPGFARLAGRQSQLDQPPAREERHVLQTGGKTVPVEAALGDLGFALAAVVAAGLLADRCQGLVDQQRLVAGQHVQRAKASGEVGRQAVGRRASSGARPSNVLRCRPALRVAHQPGSCFRSMHSSSRRIGMPSRTG